MWYTYSLYTQVYSLLDIIAADILLSCPKHVLDNRPFPSSLVSLFESESKCETILMKMTVICIK